MKIERIGNTTELESCVSYLKKQNSISLDLEFDKNLHRYGFNICLIQIATEERCFVIDPLSKIMDFTKVFTVFEDQNIEKIVFAFGEDHRLLNLLGCQPKNVYDLNNATKLLNLEPGSLGKYLKDVLDVDVSASAQLSNWFKRPLTDKQITYASEDVLYLSKLKKALVKQADVLGISKWIEEENSIIDNTVYDIDYKNEYIREKDKKGLNEVQWHLLLQLLKLRESIAIDVKKPSYQVLDINFMKDVVHDITKLNHWDMKRSALKSLRNEDFKNKLYILMKKSEEEAKDLNLSADNPAKKRSSKEVAIKNKAFKIKLEEVKKTHFKPVQSLIRRDFGDHSTTFILSNRLMESILRGDAELPSYKKHLFLKYAEELSIDMNELL